MININDLPDEVIEFIMSHLPPYNDLEACSLVCKRWNEIVHNVRRHTNLNLHKGLADFRLCWKSIVPIDIAPQIAGRFSHSAIVHKNSMYIFGGCSSTETTFNDLWRFDLSRRQWIRPLSRGTYPSPKASASMVCHNNSLILFGGWRHPSSYPPYQPWCLFDDLHVYNILENRWTVYTPIGGPPPMTGQSATIHRNTMVVFGGYQKTEVSTGNSNEVWCLDLETFTWSQPEMSELKPPPRYGQYQICLDETYLMILGGCGGPNNIFSDAWTLDMSGEVWQWKIVTIKNKKWAASHMWQHPACKVGSKLVVLGPTASIPSDFQFVRQHMPHNNSRNLRPIHPPPHHHRPNRNFIIEEANRRLQEERNRPINRENIVLNAEPQVAANLNRINIKDDAVIRLQRNLQLRSREEGPFLPKRFDEPIQDRLCMAAFSIKESPSMPPSRERQLEFLRRMEEQIGMRRAMERQSEDIPSPKRMKNNCVALFVCDIENILSNEPTLDWMEYKNYGIVMGAPERLIHSSIVAGNGELIMFGGLLKESQSNTPTQVSNSLHFLTFPRDVI